MTNEEIIKKLKENLVMFEFLTDEEQRYLKRAGKENCLYLSEWGGWKDSVQDGGHFCSRDRYRLKSDYQEKPEEKIVLFPLVEGELYEFRDDANRKFTIDNLNGFYYYHPDLLWAGWYCEPMKQSWPYPIRLLLAPEDDEDYDVDYAIPIAKLDGVLHATHVAFIRKEKKNG